MCLNQLLTFRHPNFSDLKLNILVDNNGHACLAGFGLLTMASDELTATFSFIEGGTTQWMSPELLVPENFSLKEARPTKASDCYALGMVMYEALSGQEPFAEYKDHHIVMLKIIEGIRPRRPRGKEGELFTNDIWNILGFCWKKQPRHRISASAVLLRLEKHPPLPMPTSNVDRDVKTGSSNQWKTGSSSQWKSGSDGQSYLSDHDQPDTDFSMFSPSYLGPIFNYPCATIELPIVRGDNKLPLPPRTVDPEGGSLGHPRKMFKVATKSPTGFDELGDPPVYTP